MLANEWEAEDLNDWGVELPGDEKSQLIDLKDDLESKYEITIECENEEQQQLVYQENLDKGYKCRLSTL